jgi:hypothetical protein
MNTEKNTTQKEKEQSSKNEDRQGIDKMPQQEKGKKEKVTPDDLKGKKVDGDPEKESDKPLERN